MGQIFGSKEAGLNWVCLNHARPVKLITLGEKHVSMSLQRIRRKLLFQNHEHQNWYKGNRNTPLPTFGQIFYFFRMSKSKWERRFHSNGGSTLYSHKILWKQAKSEDNSLIRAASLPLSSLSRWDFTASPSLSSLSPRGFTASRPAQLSNT